MIRGAKATVFLLLALAGVTASADMIPLARPASIAPPYAVAPNRRANVDAEWMSFAPFTAAHNARYRRFADPLGIAIDAELKLFGGTVQNMELLSDFSEPEPEDPTSVVLPATIARPEALLVRFSDYYLQGKRPIDDSLLNLRLANVIFRNGLPVTSETSPLVLAGYGSIAQNRKPVLRHWTECPDQDKRSHVMEEVPPHLRGKWESPTTCYDI